MTVIEKEHNAGGLCADYLSWQECGPHAFHTDDEEVWGFVQRLAAWRPFALRVHVQTDPALRELPYRRDDDPAFRIYSEKAWGLPFDELPASIRARARPLSQAIRPNPKIANKMAIKDFDYLF